MYNLSFTRFGKVALVVFSAIMVAGLCLAVSRPLTVSAAGTVTNCADDTQLRSFLASGGNVTFNCGASPVTIILASQITIAANATLDGGGNVTLSGGNATRVFSVTTGINFTLQNLTIANGKAVGINGSPVYQGGIAYGGSIYNNGLLTIKSSSFISNTIVAGTPKNGDATSPFGQSGNSSFGGAIYSSPVSSLTIISSNFNGNTALGGSGGSGFSHSVTNPGQGYGGANGGSSIGGAISSDGNLIISSSNFTGNHSIGGSGGNGGDGSGSNNNGGDGGGGGIAGFGAIGSFGTAIISNTNFLNNDAIGGAGGTGGSADSGSFPGRSALSGGAEIGAVGNQPNGSNAVNSLDIYNSTFTSNNVIGSNASAGAVSSGNGSLNIVGSTFANNLAMGTATNNTNSGGALSLESSTVSVTNSTFIGNNVKGSYASGGAIQSNSSTLNIINSTFVDNNVNNGGYGSDAGFVYAFGGNVTVSNTIVADAAGNNCYPTFYFHDGGYNLEYSGSNPNTCNFTDHAQSGDPKLGSLANNGGPTQTLALQAGSPAIDNGNDAVCAASPVNNLDQRGAPRPAGAHCDIGAFEYNTAPPPSPILSISPTNLNFAANVNGSNPASQTVTLTATNGPISYISNIVYGSGATGWLALTPTSSTIVSGTNQTLVVTATTGSLTAGTYTATVTFQDTANAADKATVTVTFVVSAPPPPTNFTYNLPLLANGANSPVGQTTTYVTFQNLANSPASFTLQYYDINTGAAAAQQTFTLPALGQAAPGLNLTPGQSYGGIVSSNQPLNLVVAEGLPSGGSAYNVSSATASTLYSPLALNGQYGFQTAITVFNGGSAASTGNLLFFDDAGNAVPGATKAFNVPAHASLTFKQSDAGSGLGNNHAYWAKIVANNPADSLTAQVIEFGPGNFVATFNAIVPSQVASTLYAPATFNGNYNFVTGIALANPNVAAANVNIKYYTADGTNVFTQTNLPIAANGVIGIFQPNVSGLPPNITSAVISSNQPLISTINERGPGTIAGTYIGLATGKTSVALPVMANGAFGFVTGATVFNTGSNPAHFSFSYLKQDGTSAVAAQTITLAPSASFLVYQGDVAQHLPGGFFGTAVLSSDQPLLVTTNALNTSNNLFYTYTEPS